MKQLGNLAVVCAQRSDVKLDIFDGGVTVRVCRLPKEIVHILPWDDDNAVRGLVYELNHGRLKRKRMPADNFKKVPR